MSAFASSRVEDPVVARLELDDDDDDEPLLNFLETRARLFFLQASSFILPPLVERRMGRLLGSTAHAM